MGKKKKAKKSKAAGHSTETGEFQAGVNRDLEKAVSTVEPGVAVNVLSHADVSSD